MKRFYEGSPCSLAPAQLHFNSMAVLINNNNCCSRYTIWADLTKESGEEQLCQDHNFSLPYIIHVYVLYSRYRL